MNETIRKDAKWKLAATKWKAADKAFEKAKLAEERLGKS